MANAHDPRFWPEYFPIPGFSQGVICSVCGALVADIPLARGNHQLFHGMIWRLVVGDPNAVNERVELEVRAWLHSIDGTGEPARG